MKRIFLDALHNFFAELHSFRSMHVENSQRIYNEFMCYGIKILLNSHPNAMVCTCALLESANISILAEEIYTIPSTMKNGIKLALLTINAIQYHHHYHHQHNHFLPPFSQASYLFFKCSYSKALYPLYCLFLSLSLSLKCQYFNKVVHWYH